MSGAGSVHSGGRYAQMCTFSRLYAREYQVLSGSRARMLKKSKVLTGFFFTGLSQNRAHQRRSVSGSTREIIPGSCVRRVFWCVPRALWWRGVRSIVRFNVNICQHFAPLSLLPHCFPVIKRCSSRQNVGRCVRLGRCAAHGFLTASQLIAKG